MACAIIFRVFFDTLTMMDIFLVPCFHRVVVLRDPPMRPGISLLVPCVGMKNPVSASWKDNYAHQSLLEHPHQLRKAR